MNRKVTYRVYPTKKQEIRLFEVLNLHRQLYNYALEQRIRVYSDCWNKQLSYYDQAKDLTDLRKYDENYRNLVCQSEQQTLIRLDRAYKSFFRRLKSGEKPGFPRFKSFDRYPGWNYPVYNRGWSLNLESKQKTLTLHEVGTIKIRGNSRNIGTPKTLDICHKHGKWYASVTIECTPVRNKGTKEVGLDWGVKTFATIVSDTDVETIENPRNLRNNLEKLKKVNQDLSRKKRGSNNRKKARKVLSKLHEKISNVRKNFLHKTTAYIVSQVSSIATEKLNVQSMTEGSKNHGLNREILDTSPATFIQMLKYKAEEAGVIWHEIDTKKVKPSQTCSGCFRQKKKELSERTHNCEDCGLILDRDINAAKVMLLTSRGTTRCKSKDEHEVLNVQFRNLEITV